MIRLFLLCCVFLITGGFFFSNSKGNAGYILLMWGNTSIEMSLWLGLIILLIFFVILLFFIVSTRSAFCGVKSATHKLATYRITKAQKQTISGLVAFIVNDWYLAYKKLTRSAKQATTPILNYLASAHCAYQLGDEKSALQLLYTAKKYTTQDSDLAIALIQARIQLSKKRYTEALYTLERTSVCHPRHPVVLTLQKTAYIALRDWNALKEILPLLHQKKIGTVKERYCLEQILFRKSFLEIINDKTQEDSEIISAIKLYWNGLPRRFQQDEKIVIDYVSALITLKRHDEAHTILTLSLKYKWHDEWMRLYGLVLHVDAKKALIYAETWLQKKYVNHPILLLSIGRLCLQNKQWGRAKHFFTHSADVQATADAYAELARLQAFLGEEKESQETTHQGLLNSVNSLANIEDFKQQI